MAYIDFIKAKKSFCEKYNQLIEESKANGEYYKCDSNTVRKYVFNPYSEFCRLYMENPDSPMSLEIPSHEALPCNIDLPTFFSFLKSLTQDQILHYISKMQIDMIFKEDVLESIEMDDYKLFKGTAKSSREDFEKFAGIFKSLYFIESIKQSDSDLDTIENDDDIYEIVRHELLYGINVFSMPNYIKNGSFTYIAEYIENAINQATSTFPTKEAFSDGVSLENWHYDKFSYCLYMRFLVDCMIVIGLDPFIYRILWHPSAIKLRLKWSAINALLPTDQRTVPEGFFDNPHSQEEDHFNYLRPEFEASGELALERFLDLCPFKNGVDGYMTFVYRITGISKPNISTLSTDLFFSDSAPYIYYFIKGIVDPSKSEDVYGKMKRFFATTDFPEDENDIPEPCDSWKKALAELYPTIFGDIKPKSVKKNKRIIIRDLPFPALPDKMNTPEILSKIGNSFFGDQDIQKLYNESSLESPLEWNDEWGKLAYIFRIIYTGELDERQRINSVAEMPNGIWMLIEKCFTNNGNHPNSLKTSSWNKLHDKYGEKIDSKFVSILEEAGRKR